MGDTKEEKLELRLINPTEGGFLEHIDWNSKEIKEQLAVKLEHYRNLAYTEEDIKDAKEDRAILNSLKKDFEDRRKAIKKACLEPYEKFEKEYNEVKDMIDEPIQVIDSQIKEFEKKQREEKRAALEKTYTDNIGELWNVLPFSSVCENQFLNVSYSLKKAQKEITERIETVRRDLQTIDALDSKYKVSVKDVYLSTMDLSKALAENTRLLELESKLEAEQKKKEEEEKRLQEEKAKAEAEAKKEEVVENPQVVNSEPESEAKAEEVNKSSEEQKEQQPEATEKKEEVPEKRYIVRFYAKGSKEKLEALIEYMKANNIEYGRLEKK